ncbi:hypothetical protein ACFWM1_28445 [Nocardia sp. NPDC058379]|uniref:hypothetical protein n=1 Tax=unclassified Nocardia TaxID=2637762 RepID=UPI00365C3B63
MTREHLPPEATGNDSSVTLYRHVGGELEVVKQFAQGHALESLCTECNGGAGHRGLPQAYTAWHEDTVGHLHAAAAAFHQETGCDYGELWSASKTDGSAIMLPLEHGRGVPSERIRNLHPGRIVRHILGGFLAVQHDRRLLDDHPQLKAAYFSDSPASIAPFTLHVALANVGTAYFNTGAEAMTLEVATGVSSTTECWVMGFSPFLMILVKGDESPINATRIDHWFERPSTETFGRRNDRTVAYPIALRSNPLVGFLYDTMDQFPR